MVGRFGSKISQIPNMNLHKIMLLPTKIVLNIFNIQVRNNITSISVIISLHNNI